MKRAAISLLLLAGCTSAAAPIDYGGRARAPTEASASRERPAQPEPDWAAAEGTPLSVYALRPEDVQPHDPANLPRSHRMRAGETLFDVAVSYQVPLRALIEQNHLQPPYDVAPGREVQLPPPRMHVVERGESFEDVARRYNVDTRSLALLNRMQPPYSVRQGERIVLPAMAGAHAPERPEPASPQARPPAAPAARFVWPLRGEIAARFGAQAGGQRLDGVEIAGREGAAIAAAADGSVVYAGDDLPAYGHLVIIAHADNYVTAYGFARRALVREGERVRAGQPVAELGARPGGARLMFQVRLNGAPVDPAPLLGTGD